MNKLGRIHSLESFGTVDGPGIRFVVFMQGCPLRCQFCHNPDTWDVNLGDEYTPDRLMEEIIKYKAYMNHSGGGVTFTGGEPLLKPNQKAIIQILTELDARDNLPKYITFETNSTTVLLPEFVEAVRKYQAKGVEFLASCSPKLFNVSGELNKRAWNHDVSYDYYKIFDKITYKFVVNNNEASWIELDDYISKMKHQSDNIYVMPVGATLEQQSADVIAEIAKKALARGFHVSGRLHCYMFGNGIGT